MWHEISMFWVETSQEYGTYLIEILGIKLAGWTGKLPIEGGEQATKVLKSGFYLLAMSP